jgi:uncharacterized protein
VDTEVAISQLDPKLHSTYRYLAVKQIKHTLTSNRQNILHKRQQHNINQKKVLENNNLKLAKADKSKAIVIIDTDMLNVKINNFIKENHTNLLNKDLTEIYQKQTYHAIQECNILTFTACASYRLGRHLTFTGRNYICCNAGKGLMPKKLRPAVDLMAFKCRTLKINR